MAEALYQQQASGAADAAGAGAQGTAGGASGASGDDVIDAEYIDVDEKK
jgi:hypothetical protein